MGDRSNIVIEDTYGEVPNRVYLYSHWAGERIIESAVHGLNSSRATDAEYLARIVFEDMVKEDLGGETGFGIAARLGDNEHPILVISDTRTDGTVVYFENQREYGEEFVPVTRKIPYKDFVTLVESTEGWKDMANRNELYEPLMANMK